MKKIGDMSSEEIAAFVCSHLITSGIDVVLSGGSCVSIYSENKYLSYDFDFITRDLFCKRSTLTDAMKVIGFSEKNRYFEHPDTEYLVEFPPGPLTVGDEPVKKIEQRVYETGTLKIISASDSVKDRLAGYYHWKDLQCLEQAILICSTTSIDKEEVRRWSEAEGMTDKFNEISLRLFQE